MTDLARCLLLLLPLTALADVTLMIDGRCYTPTPATKDVAAWACYQSNADADSASVTLSVAAEKCTQGGALLTRRDIPMLAFFKGENTDPIGWRPAVCPMDRPPTIIEQADTSTTWSVPISKIYVGACFATSAHDEAGNDSETADFYCLTPDDVRAYWRSH